MLTMIINQVFMANTVIIFTIINHFKSTMKNMTKCIQLLLPQKLFSEEEMYPYYLKSNYDYKFIKKTYFYKFP